MKKSNIKIITVSGRRKSSIAKATIKEGNGEVRINKFPVSQLPPFRRLAIEEPLRISQQFIPQNFQILVNVSGGGVESQIEAARLAIARAIIAFSKAPELRRAFQQYDRFLLVADTRHKEQRKPNDSRARAARQKSYR